MKLLRTIRLDPSDTFVFEKAAATGEWAVTGSFLFMMDDVVETAGTTLVGKRRAAFRSGFVGVQSLGFSTLVVVTDATAEDREQAIEQLAATFVEQLGAPDLATARLAAIEEVDFTATLSHHDTGALVAMHRSVEDGGIREQFRVLQDREKVVGADSLHSHSRAFLIVEEDDEEDEIIERVDLATLATKDAGVKGA